MTDINHLPKGYDLPENRMTREEWKHYFECREKYDVKYSPEEIKKLRNDLDNAFNKNDFDEYFSILQKLPFVPGYALSLKRTDGLKSVWEFNLSKAKEVYPDEFWCSIKKDPFIL